MLDGAKPEVKAKGRAILRQFENQQEPQQPAAWPQSEGNYIRAASALGQQLQGGMAYTLSNSSTPVSSYTASSL